MSGTVIVDTSVWIDFFAGEDVPALAGALRAGGVMLPGLVVAELISGARRPEERSLIEDLVSTLPCHQGTLPHWVRVGELRRSLRDRGLQVSTPDVHVAQVALDHDAWLLTRDRIFSRIAETTALKLLPE